MNKLLTLLFAATAAVPAKAVTLFPFFVDVAGDYTDKTPQQLAPLGMDFMYTAKSSFFGDLQSSDTFLMDVMPFSSEPITRDEYKKGDASVVTYSSPQENGAVSTVYLISLPGDEFWIAYTEQ